MLAEFEKSSGKVLNYNRSPAKVHASQLQPPYLGQRTLLLTAANVSMSALFDRGRERPSADSACHRVRSPLQSLKEIGFLQDRKPAWRETSLVIQSLTVKKTVRRIELEMRTLA